MADFQLTMHNIQKHTNSIDRNNVNIT